MKQWDGWKVFQEVYPNDSDNLQHMTVVKRFDSDDYTITVNATHNIDIVDDVIIQWFTLSTDVDGADVFAFNGAYNLETPFPSLESAEKKLTPEFFEWLIERATSQEML